MDKFLPKEVNEMLQRNMEIGRSRITYETYDGSLQDVAGYLNHQLDGRAMSANVVCMERLYETTSGSIFRVLIRKEV